MNFLGALPVAPKRRWKDLDSRAALEHGELIDLFSKSKRSPLPKAFPPNSPIAERLAVAANQPACRFRRLSEGPHANHSFGKKKHPFYLNRTDH